MTILIFIIILAILILVHELGHFLIAKKAGIRVDEFGLGFPPRLWSKTYGETTYSLNSIPFGGFVKIHGETPDEDSQVEIKDDRSLVSKPKWIQASVMAGGVAFNFILAWLLLSVGFMIGLPMPTSDLPTGATVRDAKLSVVYVLPDSPAAEAGLKPGDAILSLSSSDSEVIPIKPVDVSDFVAGVTEGEFLMLISRGGEEMDLTLNPVTNLTEDLSGLAIGISTDQLGLVSLPIHRSLLVGAVYTFNITISMVVLLGQLLADVFAGQSALDAVVGPVGIVGLVGDAATLGFVYLLTFTALISINLAIINLLPFPALDGGRLLFILIEAIKGSPIKPQVANTLNALGFLFLIGLMLIITFNDILRLF